MLEFKSRPDGRYTEYLSGLSPELFDLVVAASNLLESKDVSSAGLLDKTMAEENTAQDILSAIISELEELEGKDIMNVYFEIPYNRHTGVIECFDINGDIE